MTNTEQEFLDALAELNSLLLKSSLSFARRVHLIYLWTNTAISAAEAEEKQPCQD